MIDFIFCNAVPEWYDRFHDKIRLSTAKTGPSLSLQNCHSNDRSRLNPAGLISTHTIYPYL